MDSSSFVLTCAEKDDTREKLQAIEFKVKGIGVKQTQYQQRMEEIRYGVQVMNN